MSSPFEDSELLAEPLRILNNLRPFLRISDDDSGINRGEVGLEENEVLFILLLPTVSSVLRLLRVFVFVIGIAGGGICILSSPAPLTISSMK